jgi:alkylated DNA repair dioxygenase AlkB
LLFTSAIWRLAGKPVPLFPTRSRAARLLRFSAVLVGQQSLFGGGEPDVDETFAGMQRRELDGDAWVEYQSGWVSGQETLFEHLARTTEWHRQRREMYEKTVDVPRLVASLPADGPGHPVLEKMRRALSLRYGEELTRTGLALYRDGSDSVAWHGDYVARELPRALVATVSLGEPRRFLLRPREGGQSLAYRLGFGDVIVMGGTCQRTWQHSIPKVAHAGPRLVVMFRPVWGPGDQGPRGY